MHHAKLIVSAHPCTACQITTDLNAETLRRVRNMRNDFDFAVVLIDRPRDIAKVNGIEVELLPAVLIDGEQVSAGSVISPRQIVGILESMELNVA